jgi:hypothetical protein
LGLVAVGGGGWFETGLKQDWSFVNAEVRVRWGTELVFFGRGVGLELVSAVFAVDRVCWVLCLAVAAEAGRWGSRDREGLAGSCVQVELVSAFALEP